MMKCVEESSTDTHSVGYTYDNINNLTALVDRTGDGSPSWRSKTQNRPLSCEYDSANQLIRENHSIADTTTIWTYDNAGNILTREVYPQCSGTPDPSTRISVVNYTYGDSDWGDLLTAYNGVSITHDEIGNPLNDGTWTYTWQHGRQLASMAKIDQSEAWQFTYNADGMRTQRTNGTTTYNYTYLGSQLTHMTVDGHTMYFAYDAAGTPMAMTYDGVNYYYVTNIQGDVIFILDNTGTELVRYIYDAWGNLISTDYTDAAKDENENVEESIVELSFYNPLRYRGYVYDAETGLYYLQSRYYSSEIGRWINMDNYISTGLGVIGYNTFAYCNNNPILLVDVNGEFPWLAVGIIAVCVVAGGIWGFTRNSKLIPQETKSTTPVETSPRPPHHNLSPWTPPVNTSPPPVQNNPDKGTVQNNPGKGKAGLSTPDPDVHTEGLSINDRIENMFIGAGIGLAVGGAITSVVGIVGSVAAGSAFTYIAAFGGTGAQTFSIGAVAYDLFAMIAAPIFGVEMETIELEPR